MCRVHDRLRAHLSVVRRRWRGRRRGADGVREPVCLGSVVWRVGSRCGAGCIAPLRRVGFGHDQHGCEHCVCDGVCRAGVGGSSRLAIWIDRGVVVDDRGHWSSSRLGRPVGRRDACGCRADRGSFARVCSTCEGSGDPRLRTSSTPGHGIGFCGGHAWSRSQSFGGLRGRLFSGCRSDRRGSRDDRSGGASRERSRADGLVDPLQVSAWRFRRPGGGFGRVAEAGDRMGRFE